jgi:hypothetical protein
MISCIVANRSKPAADAMWARWNHIQASLFPWLRKEVEPMTEQLGRLITILDVIGLGSFVPEPPRARVVRPRIAPPSPDASSPRLCLAFQPRAP